MRIGPEADYEVHNLVTGEWSYFHTYEALEKDGGAYWIVAGLISKHNIWLPSTRGRVNVASRIGGFVVVSDASMRLMKGFLEEPRAGRLTTGIRDPQDGPTEIRLVLNSATCALAAHDHACKGRFHGFVGAPESVEQAQQMNLFTIEAFRQYRARQIILGNA